MDRIKLFLVWAIVVFTSAGAFAAPYSIPKDGTRRMWNEGANSWCSYINPLFNYFDAAGGVLPEYPVVLGPLSVSGAGNSWLELGNNTSFTDVLTGKGGYGLLNWLPYAILNGEQKRLALFEELAAGDTSIIQDDDPTLASATGKYYSRASGGYFNVVHGVEMFALAGTRTADETDPVIGDITPSSITHDGAGVSLSATIASVTETNEDDREWSLYDVTAGAIVGGWTTFTGLSITGITIPADQHTYRLDVRVTDLAGNTGTASSSNIAYEAGASCSDGTCTGFLVCQNFEGTGYDNSETPTESVAGGGYVDEDDTTSIVGRGSQSLAVIGDASAGSYARLSFTSGTDIWLHAKVKFSDSTPSTATTFLSFGGNYYVQLRMNGAVRLYVGTAYNEVATGQFADNTWKHVWVHITASSGANDGVSQLYLSDTETRPAASINATDGARTSAMTSIDLNSSRNYSIVYFDQVLISSTEIGDVCE